MRRAWAISAFAFVVLFAPRAGAQPLSMNYRNSYPLGDTAVDQFGQSFTVTGLSGITWIGADQFLAVMDNSDKLVRLSVTFAAEGDIESASIAGGLTLALSRDFEGIAYTNAVRNSVFLSEENTPGLVEFSLADGSLLRTLDVPAVFAHRRANLGFESMTRRASGPELWTANEAALTVDGPVSSPSNGTVVRLLHYSTISGQPTPDVQYAYLTEPMHGGDIQGGTSGVSDLVVLPDGRLIVLERSLALSFPNLFKTRIYQVGFDGATDVSGFTDGLIGQSYTLAQKTLLSDDNLANVEGLCLGPPLPSGRRAFVGVIDDGDPISINALVSYEVDGADPPCLGLSPCDANCDGSVNGLDIQPFRDLLLGAAPCSSCGGDANGDGSVNGLDVEAFVECLAG